MFKEVKVTSDDNHALWIFPSGLTIEGDFVAKTWSMTAGDKQIHGKIVNKELHQMADAAKELGAWTAGKCVEFSEADDEAMLQYYGRLQFDVNRFTCYARGIIPHPDVYPYPPDSITTEDLSLGCIITAAMATAPTAAVATQRIEAIINAMAEGETDNLADKFREIDESLRADGPTAPPAADDEPAGEDGWVPEGWDLPEADEPKH